MRRDYNSSNFGVIPLKIRGKRTDFNGESTV